jgi:peptidoglycan-associated lipoprotein
MPVILAWLVALQRPGSSQDFTVNVGDRILFDLDFLADPRRCTADAVEAGSVAASAIRSTRSPSKAMLTNAVHVSTNLALGQRRAAATRDFLSARGVPTSRMRTVSYGNERPIAVCDNNSCWSQNRRAVTVLNGAGS